MDKHLASQIFISLLTPKNTHIVQIFSSHGVNGIVRLYTKAFSVYRNNVSSSTFREKSEAGEYCN